VPALLCRCQSFQPAKWYVPLACAVFYVIQLLVDEFVHSQRPQFATETGAFPTAEWHFGPFDRRAVDIRHTNVEFLGNCLCPLGVFREYGSTESKLGIVRELNRLGV